MHNSPTKPGKTLPVFSEGKERCDEGRKVVVTSVGGVKEGHDLQKLRYHNPKSVCNQDVIGWCRGCVNEVGTVVEGPYRIQFKAKEKQRTKTGKIIKDRYGKVKYRDGTFVTEPYWMVQLDASGVCLHFSEKELTFLD